MTRKLATYLFAGAITGCGTGVSTDPIGQRQGPGDPQGTTLSTATHLLSNVLATAALAGGQNDATYLVIVADPATRTAKLVRHDVRGTDFTELDSMPIGEGAPQIVANNADDIVWGFAADRVAVGSFRLVPSSGATSALSFGSHAPSFVLLEQYSVITNNSAVIYDSVNDCSLEQNGLDGQDFVATAAMSCFATVEAAAMAGDSLWIRTDDAPGKTIWQMDTYWVRQVLPVASSVTDVVGPVANPADHTAVWIIPGADGAHVLAGPDSVFPTAAQDVLTIPGTVSAATYVHGVLWGALGDSHTLFQVTHSGLVQYSVDYWVSSLFGLHDRLIVRTEDGELIEQLITLGP